MQTPRPFVRLSQAEQDEIIANVDKLLKDRRKQNIAVEKEQRIGSRRKRDFADQADNDFMLNADCYLSGKDS